MAIIHIVADEHGIVRVEEREGTFFQHALKGKDIALILGRGLDAVNPLKFATYAFVNDVTVAAILDSNRLSEPEKIQYLNILAAGNPLTDDFEGEEIPGEFVRTHPVTDVPGPPTYKVITRVVDP